ncbi:ribosomal L37ae protein family-domain-containing protein [Podospora didyma]|uniref:Ribosomal L37ae protein family-domain-containing protein n=1 Tax=Podospora didyma TaxID=330526 RepID=A0AAE0KKI9_9PEZI|nr:ribosomal L37ae protein family-domain-containing protein [Podospora didyma]
MAKRTISMSLFFFVFLPLQKRNLLTSQQKSVSPANTAYGASLRKQIKRLEITQSARYVCAFCGKKSVKRVATGIWECRRCKKTLAGGAYLLTCGSKPLDPSPAERDCGSLSFGTGLSFSSADGYFGVITYTPVALLAF